MMEKCRRGSTLKPLGHRYTVTDMHLPLECVLLMTIGIELWNECNYYKMTKDAVNTAIQKGGWSTGRLSTFRRINMSCLPIYLLYKSTHKRQGNNAQFRTKINANGMTVHMNDGGVWVQLATKCTNPGLPGFAEWHTGCMSECVEYMPSNL